MIDLGTIKPGSTIRIPFGSFAAATGAPAAVTNYADADIQVYKDGSTTQRASAAGLTATTTFDTLTGVNLVTLDTADNTTAGFWAAGSEYFVVLSDITVDGQTLRFPIARLRLGLNGSILDTTIATLSSQTSFTLTVGPAEDNALVGCQIYFHDVASAVQGGFGYCTAYTGSTKTVTLAVGPSFTIAASDNVMVFTRTQIYGIGGTVQTARDLGASVLLSSGTGTGQLDFTSGVVKSSLVQILGTAIAGTASQISAAFTKFFDKASPTGTINSLPDAVPGAANGVFIAGTNAATTITTALTTTFTGNVTGSVGSVTGLTAATVHSDLDDIQSRLPAALTANGNMKSSLVEILTTALTETAGQIAAAFKQFFDVATPTGTMKAITNVVTTTTATNVTTLSAGSISTGSFVAGAVNATVAPNLDAAVTSRMATYTQPTGFLAATFPTGTVANTTNITAGTVTTATNVTTVNGLGANVITAASLAADASAEIADAVLDEVAVTYVGKPDTLRKLVWFMRKIWVNKRKYDKATNHQLVYEDDGTTPMLDATMVNDASEATRGAA